MAVVQRALTLADRIKTIALQQADAGAWLSMWKPVMGALVRLAKTVGKLIMSLRNLGEPTGAPDEDLRDEIAEELREIAEDFPDIADVLFGMRHLDEVYAALVQDDDAREAAAALSATTIAVLDRFLGVLVDIIMGERESPISPDKIVELLGRYEELVQGLLDRWLR